MKKLIRKLFNLDQVEELQKIREHLNIIDNTPVIDKINQIIDKKEFVPASAAIDWAEMCAFSVELAPYDKSFSSRNSRTVIGYTKELDGKLTQSEWILYVSVEEHERLVKEFKEYVKNKNEKIKV